MPVGTSSSVAADVSLGWMALAKFGMMGMTYEAALIELVHALFLRARAVVNHPCRVPVSL